MTFIWGYFCKKISQPPIIKISLKVAYLKFYSNLPGVNEFKIASMTVMMSWHGDTFSVTTWISLTKGHWYVGFDVILLSVWTSHYNDVIISVMASQITSLIIGYSTVNSGVNQRKHQSFASLAFVWGIHQWQVNSPHKWPVIWKMFPFDYIIMSLNKQWQSWWFQIPWPSCNITVVIWLNPVKT